MTRMHGWTVTKRRNCIVATTPYGAQAVHDMRNKDKRPIKYLLRLWNAPPEVVRKMTTWI